MDLRGITTPVTTFSASIFFKTVVLVTPKPSASEKIWSRFVYAWGSFGCVGSSSFGKPGLKKLTPGGAVPCNLRHCQKAPFSFALVRDTVGAVGYERAGTASYASPFQPPCLRAFACSISSKLLARPLVATTTVQLWLSLSASAAQ